MSSVDLNASTISNSDQVILPANFSFKEKNGYTYYVKKKKPVSQDAWIFNFTMQLKYDVDGSKNSGPSGKLFELRTKRNQAYAVFIRNTSWTNTQNFTTDLHEGNGLSAGNVSTTAAVLNKYSEWKSLTYANGQNDPPVKYPVTSIGIQNDNKTWVFGPNVMFERKDGELVPVTPEACPYAWIPRAKLAKDIKVYDGEVAENLLDELEKQLPKESFDVFTFMLGHTWTSFYYSYFCHAGNINGIPPFFAVGVPDTQKTILANTTLAPFADGLKDQCAFFEMTAASLLSRWRHSKLPIVLQDPKDPVFMTYLIESSYEQKLHSNYANSKDGPGVQPMSSVLATVNPGMFKAILDKDTDRLKIATRVVAFSLNTKVPESSVEEDEVLSRAKKAASKFVTKLLCHGGEDFLRLFRSQISSTAKMTSSVVQHLGITTGDSRIARNWAVILVATEYVLQAFGRPTNREELLDKMKPHMEFTAQFQLEAGSSFHLEKHCSTSVVQTEFLEKLKADFVSALEYLRSIVPKDEFAVMCKTDLYRDGELHVAIHLAGAQQHLKSRKDLNIAMTAGSLLALPGTKKDHNTTFRGHTQRRCFVVPKQYFNAEQLARVDGSELDQTGCIAENGNNPISGTAPLVETGSPNNIPLETPTVSKAPEQSAELLDLNESRLDAHASTLPPLPESKNQFNPLANSSALKLDAVLTDNPAASSTSAAGSNLNDTVLSGDNTVLGKLGITITSREDLDSTKSSLNKRFGNKTWAQQPSTFRCPDCKKSVGSGVEGSEWLRCTSAQCGQPFHVGCGGLSSVVVRGRRGVAVQQWVCSFCVGKKRQRKK